MLYDGCWYVECEVAHEAANDTLAEIYRELALLRKQPILADELDMLKNYLLGTYLTMVDGPFNTAELLKTLLADRLPLAAFSQMVETTRNITAENLQQLAQTYLQPDSFWEVRVEPGE
jgi:predicted Zn-dependent peptidase